MGNNSTYRQFILITLLTLSLQGCTGTTTDTDGAFTVSDFSERYSAKVSVEDPSEVFSKGWVAVHDKVSGEEILRAESDELVINLYGDELRANVQQLPYGEQSVVIHQDFNFDGVKDVALMDGQKSCYHGPSFQIYLAEGDGFAHSPSFTRLAQEEYCGMFQVIPEKQEIHTMTKSGCCWHQYSTFIVENNQPKEIRIVTEEEADIDTLRTTTETLIDGQWQKTTEESPIEL